MSQSVINIHYHFHGVDPKEVLNSELKKALEAYVNDLLPKTPQSVSVEPDEEYLEPVPQHESMFGWEREPFKESFDASPAPAWEVADLQDMTFLVRKPSNLTGGEYQTIKRMAADFGSTWSPSLKGFVIEDRKDAITFAKLAGQIKPRV